MCQLFADRVQNYSCNLHTLFCRIFVPNSVIVTRYDALIRDKSPTNRDAHLAESIFQICSSDRNDFRSHDCHSHVLPHDAHGDCSEHLDHTPDFRREEH